MFNFFKKRDENDSNKRKRNKDMKKSGWGQKTSLLRSGKPKQVGVKAIKAGTAVDKTRVRALRYGQDPLRYAGYRTEDMRPGKADYVIARIGKGTVISGDSLRRETVTKDSMEHLISAINGSEKTVLLRLKGLSRAQVGKVVGDIKSGTEKNVKLRALSPSDTGERLLNYIVKVE